MRGSIAHEVEFLSCKVRAGSERAQASLGRMVKAQKSTGRKSPHCHHIESGGQMEMEENQTETQRSPASQPSAEDQSSDQTQPQAAASAEALLEKWDQAETPMDNQEKGDFAAQLQSQAKPLWKPIPPLLPEPETESCRSTSPETRDQSCQTEEQPQQTSDSSHSHNRGYCVEPGDPPLLQQPLPTSKSGIQQIIECFRSGTSQLRHMLLREVDTIFECKVCRSLFRGLPNLITHKEYYCLSRLPESDGSPGDDKQSVAVKDLLDAIYPRVNQPEHVVRLEPIQTTTKAVFQYLTTEEELARYPSHTPSARESPVAWEGETLEDVDNLTNQSGGPESPGHNQGRKKWDAEEETKEDPPQAEDEESTSGVEDVTISCCLCGQDFNSRRSIRRHCRKMHQTKLEELRKYTETRTVPTSLLSMVKGRPRTLSSPTGKSCPVCFKTFATKANVRRHFDEVHRGLRRDAITPNFSSRPGQSFSLDATPPKKNNASPSRSNNSKSTPVNSKTTTPSNQNQAKPQSQPPASPQANPASCRCTLCKRNYSSQLMLRRHMRIVHKIYSIKNNRSAATSASSTTAATPSSSASLGPSNNIRVKEEAVEPSDEDDEEEDIDSSPAPSPSDSTGTSKTASVAHNAKVKDEEAPSSPKMASSLSSSGSRGGSTCSGSMITKMTKLSVGFDFKQLFCKLCKRQFSSRQNLSKHIELHTDGNDIFIKFYRCPLCRYESRRKRDVLRHVTVVHKKSSAYLAKIMPKLESRAVKRLAEVVLNNTNPKRVGSTVKEEVNGRHTSSSSSSSSSPPVTRKQECSTSTGSTAASSSSAPPPAPVTRKQQDLSSATFTPSPPVTRKQERQQTHQHRPISPPMTRRSDKHTHQRNSTSTLPSNQTPHTRRHDAQSESRSSGSSSTEVKVTKNFSLHACDQCGRAFAKKLYLESHKRSHRNAATAAASRRKGVSTRSKSLVW
ncbi:LOW QUALITY PROTEIN: zinc finger protein 800b [Aulostomus maculatus]